jgi:hypothetical protein
MAALAFGTYPLTKEYILPVTATSFSVEGCASKESPVAGFARLDAHLSSVSRLSFRLALQDREDDAPEFAVRPLRVTYFGYTGTMISFSFPAEIGMTGWPENDTVAELSLVSFERSNGTKKEVARASGSLLLVV